MKTREPWAVVVVQWSADPTPADVIAYKPMWTRVQALAAQVRRNRVVVWLPESQVAALGEGIRKHPGWYGWPRPTALIGVAVAGQPHRDVTSLLRAAEVDMWRRLAPGIGVPPPRVTISAVLRASVRRRPD